MKYTPFSDEVSRLRGLVPEGWALMEPGIWLRRAFDGDPTHLVQQCPGGLSPDEILAEVAVQEGLDAPMERAGSVESPRLAWDCYRGSTAAPVPKIVDLALARHKSWVYLVVMGTAPGEIDSLHDSVFLPAIQALTSISLEPEYARQLAAHADEFQQMIRAGRKRLRNGPWPDFLVETDQERGLPIPPPQQPYDAGARLVNLPTPERAILTKTNLFDCIADRKSRRNYTDESLTIAELAYLLWATQGVRQVILGGKGSKRTVPASGSRHPFETYLAINRVHGIAPGVYRYLPFEHRLVHLFDCEDLPEQLDRLSMDQPFVGQSAVCFIWSVVPYREEWRYATDSHKAILLDAGHVCQNLYLACESIGCGTCAIAAYHQEELDNFLGLDGDDELVVYLAPVGKVENIKGA